MTTISFQEFRKNVLTFVDQCAPSEGIFDEAAWEASGRSRVLDPHSQSLMRPPAKRRIRVRTLRDRCRDNDWAFASTPGGAESIEGGHSAVEALFLLGELGRLSPENRAAWVAGFNRYQDEDSGYYLGPYVPPPTHRSWGDPRACTHTWEHMHDHLIASLCPTLMLLGGKSKVPLSEGRQTGRFLQRGYLRDFLWGRDWNDYAQDGNYRRHNPWYIGNDFWYPACILWQIIQWEPGTAAARQARRMLDEVWYDWHDRNFGVNGFWYGDLDGDPRRLWRGGPPSGAMPPQPVTTAERYWTAVAAMGGAHQLWFYDFDGHNVPDACRRTQTDLLLLLQNRHHHRFGLGDVDNPAESTCNCTDVDCMTILAINYRRQDYRRADIARALERAAQSILTDRVNDAGVLQSQPGVPFTHCFNSTATLSPGDAGNLLDQSFYLWAVIAACSVVARSDSAELQTFLEHDWPRTPSHWLWVPGGAE